MSLSGGRRRSRLVRGVRPADSTPRPAASPPIHRAIPLGVARLRPYEMPASCQHLVRALRCRPHRRANPNHGHHFPITYVPTYRTDTGQFFQAFFRTPLARTNAEIAQGSKHASSYSNLPISMPRALASVLLHVRLSSSTDPPQDNARRNRHSTPTARTAARPARGLPRFLF